MTFYLHPYPYRRLARRWVENNEQTLGINVREEEDTYILSAFVPGLKAEDLHIQVLEDVIRIEGEYKRSGPVDKRSTPQSGSVDKRSGPVDKADENSYLLQELPNGSFTRTLRLPASIDADHVDAKITDGVLTLRLPKVESARSKRIKINSK